MSSNKTSSPKSIQRNSRRFFSANPSKRSKRYNVYGPGVIPSPTLENLYRVDEIKFDSQGNQPATLRFNLFELFCFRFSNVQGLVMEKDVINHRGSTTLIGTTSCKKTALALKKSWCEGKGSRKNAILDIEPIFIQDILIDVKAIIERTGTSFYTKIENEHEHSLTILPISVIKNITLTKNGQTVINPLYIEPTPEVVEEFKEILHMQLEFFSNLYEKGKSMTTNQRQAELTAIIERTAELYQGKLGEANPYNMSLIQFFDRYGSSDNLSKELLSKNVSTKTLLDVLRSSGDELFMKNTHYAQLLSKKVTKEAIERANEENGYSSTRYSYSFD